MKITLFLLLLNVVTVFGTTYSQKVFISLNVKDAPLKDVLKEIEHKTAFSFLYKADMDQQYQKVDIDERDASVNDILVELSSKLNFNYKIIDNSIIVLTAKEQQQQNSISGTVTNSSGEPIPGATVVIKGTTRGTITDLNGNFTLSDVAPDAVLIFSFIGYLSEEIDVSGRDKFDIILIENIEELEEVVVTALGITKEKKSLGYAMQEIKSEKLNQTMSPTVNGALEGKIAGVSITQAATGVGGSSRISIRGNSSLSRSDEPLWVVDGVPMDDSQTSQGHYWSGIDFAGAAQDINPMDIEAITVLKGPNAAALYGSRAANGVIVVTTKKGATRANKGIGIKYNASIVVNKPYDIMELQDKYGQGTGGVFDVGAAGSWGPEITGQQVANWRYPGQTYAFEAHTDKLLEFCNTTVSHNHNIGIDVGNEDVSSHISLRYDDENGIMPGHEVDKYNFNVRTSGQASKRLSFDTKINYIKTNGENRPVTGINSPIIEFIQMPITIRNEDLKPGMDEEENHINWYGPDADHRNPYYRVEQNKNQDVRHRLLSFASLKLDITDGLTLSGKYGLDYHRTKWERMVLHDVIENGGYNILEANVMETNMEALLSYNKNLGDISLSLNAGANRMYRLHETLTNNSGELFIEGNFFLANGTNQEMSQGISEKEIQSVYGFGQIGYKDFLYLDVTSRNDWSSTLPKESWSYFYPSFSLSYVFTDMLNAYGNSTPGWLTFTKLRASYAKVGNDTDPYQLENNFGFSTTYNGMTIASISSQLPLIDLKPEITTSTELGFDIRVFDNRLGADFTYYNALTNNQILGVNVPVSSGFSTKLINAGEIQNKGYEFMIRSTPVKTNSFRIDLDFNYSHNVTMVNELDENAKEYTVGGVRMLNVVAIEGEKYGDIKGEAFQRDDLGRILVNSNGLPLISNTFEVVGNIQPDWIGSVNLGIHYKSVSLTGLIGIQSGGDIVSVSEAHAAAVGNAIITEDRSPIVVDGYTEAGDKNTVEVTAEEYWTHLGGIYGTAEAFMYKASFVKLNELSLSYSLPQQILKNSPFSRASVSLVGRNLFYIYKDAPAEIGGAYDRRVQGQAYDFAGLPSTRVYGLNLTVNF